MLTCHQRTRKHFSHLPLWETSKDLYSGSQCRQTPTEARKCEGGGRVRLFPGAMLTEQNHDGAPKGPGRQVVFHLLPKLHDGRGGVLQGHMAVVAHIQFLELHTVLYSGNKTRSVRLTFAKAGSWKTFRADGATRWFYLTAPCKHASKNTEGEINNLQTV